MTDLTMSADDVAALKLASDASFQLWPDGRHTIRLWIKRGARGLVDHGIYTVREQQLFPTLRWDAEQREREIEVHGRVTRYAGGNNRDAERVVCYASLWDTLRIRTLGHLLRAGHKATLHWEANDDSKLLTDAGFVCDRLTLVATREGRQRRELRVLIDVYTGRDDSVRMVRPVGSYEHGTTSPEYTLAIIKEQ